MRLSGGLRARQTVLAPKGKRTRPTGAKVREALFDILGDRIAGARVLDLFSGSGALGFEAISRGANSCVFVDSDAAAVMAIRRNAVRLIGDTERFRIMPTHAVRALRILRGTFDVIMMDPPYERGVAEELKLLMQRALLASGGVVVIEHSAATALELPTSLQAVKFAKYGDTALTFAMAVPAKGGKSGARREAAAADGRARSKSKSSAARR